MTKHLIFGAGLIGCYLGGVLSACRGANSSVELYARPQMAKTLADGITLTDYHHNHLSLPNINVLTDLTTLDNGTEYDFIWLTVKCNSVVDAVNDMLAMVSPNTVIICCQNGLGSDKPVLAAFPNNQIIKVIVPFNVILESDNHFHRGSEGHLTIESSSVDDRLLGALTAEGFNDAGGQSLLPIAFTKQIVAMQWAKLQLNLGNSVNALANIPVKSMLEQRHYRLIIVAMMKELLNVTDALGIKLPKVTSVPAHWIPRILSLPDFLFARVATKMLAIDPKVRTSMWWDLEYGRKTEIDYLNGVVVAAAHDCGVSSKVNSKVIERIKMAEQQDVGCRQSYSAVQLATELEVV